MQKGKGQCTVILLLSGQSHPALKDNHWGDGRQIRSKDSELISCYILMP
jgi:hypothetical protein